MGKLFWRFFAIFALAQVVTMAGLAVTMWVKTAAWSQMHVEHPPPSLAAYVDATTATLETSGEDGAKRLIAAWGARNGSPTIFAVDAQGRDVLGRDLPAALTDNPSDSPVPNYEMRRRVTASDGRPYEVFAVQENREPHDGFGPNGPQFGPDGGPGGGPDGPRPPQKHFFPIEPLIAGIVVSLAFGAILAWSFSRPIRSMRAAFDQASRGSLSVRLGPKMRRRRDEFADLGQDFDNMVERIEALMDGQRRLLHDVSHELRSPLARLQLAVGLARQQPERISATLDRVEREAQRMDALIDELLTLSRLEAGVIGSLEDDVRVFELIDGIIEDARFEASAAGRNIIFAQGPAVTIKGRAELLQRAIENVVRNAITHTGEGTDVHVDARADSDNDVRITIDDQGPGIPEDALPFIFRPFYRAPGQQGAPARQGHGLGLAIAKQIVDAHGGSITARNRRLGGLCVEIRLPVRRGESGRPERAPERDSLV